MMVAGGVHPIIRTRSHGLEALASTLTLPSSSSTTDRADRGQIKGRPDFTIGVRSFGDRFLTDQFSR